MYRSNLPFSFSVSSLLALLFAWSADLSAAPVELVEQAPVTISQPTPEVLLVDFGRVAFGNLELTPPADATGNIAVRFGEQLVEGRIDTDPPGTVRYAAVTVELAASQTLIVTPPTDVRNTDRTVRSTRLPR